MIISKKRWGGWNCRTCSTISCESLLVPTELNVFSSRVWKKVPSSKWGSLLSWDLIRKQLKALPKLKQLDFKCLSFSPGQIIHQICWLPKLTRNPSFSFTSLWNDLRLISDYLQKIFASFNVYLFVQVFKGFYLKFFFF